MLKKTDMERAAGADQGKATSMTMIQALRSAMDVMLERNPDVVVFGEDVGYFGGVFRCTEGLQAKYGKTRVFATTLGHNKATVADPRYLELVTRGLLWSVNKLDTDYLKPARRVLLDE